MGAFAYMSQKAETVAPKIERRIRKEIGANAPLNYTIDYGTTHTASVGSLLGDVGAALAGVRRDMPFLFYLNFQLPQPRAANLRAGIARQGLGCIVGTLLYSTPLSKRIGGEVSLETAPSKVWEMVKFVGDEAIAARLNADARLLKRIGWLTRPETQIGAMKIETRRLCKIVPMDDGALFIAAALPRPKWLGFSMTASAKEFFDTAAMIETVL
jgi:hypothetical protein